MDTSYWHQTGNSKNGTTNLKNILEQDPRTRKFKELLKNILKLLETLWQLPKTFSKVSGAVDYKVFTTKILGKCMLKDRHSRKCKVYMIPSTGDSLYRYIYNQKGIQYNHITVSNIRWDEKKCSAITNDKSLSNITQILRS